jgi:hypothetical protein
MARIIAFHGDYATPKMLKEDMGDLANEVDYFFNGHDFGEAIDLCKKFDSVKLIGFSSGGALIAELSYLKNIKSAVLYESPLGISGKTFGNFPACIIWNRNGRMRNSRFNPYREEALNMVDKWDNGRDILRLVGNGRHISFKFRFPPFGHAWDKTVNKEIKRFLENGLTY